MRPFEAHPYRRETGKKSTTSAGYLSIDRTYDCVKNMELMSFKELVRKFIVKNLDKMSRSERCVRESTLTVCATRTLTHDQICDFIENAWTNSKPPQNEFQPQEDPMDIPWSAPASMKLDPTLQEIRSYPVTMTGDKENVYLQFASCAVKNQFLDFLQLQDSISCPMKRLVHPPVPQTGFHFARKMVRIEITNVPASVSTEYISSKIASRLPENCQFSEFRDGKPHGALRKRSVMFRVNDCAFRHLFSTLQGFLAVTLQRSPRMVTTKLYFRVNCKAWRCNKCYSINSSGSIDTTRSGEANSSNSGQDHSGKHRCKGRVCSRCAGKGHEADQCTLKSRFCGNCKRVGHRSKDLSCPTYLHAVLKEMQRIDIPLEFLEEEDNLKNLADAILV